MNPRFSPDRDRLVGMLRRLVRVRSENPSSGEGAVVDLLCGILAPTADSLERIEHVGGRPNLLARYGRCDGSRPTIVLTASTDTVPADPATWTHPPFEGGVHGDELWGRGSVDMKGGIAAAVEAAIGYHTLGRPGPHDVLLAFTADGERGGRAGWDAMTSGAHWPHLVGAVVTAPSDLVPYRRERGVAWLTADLQGRTAPANDPAGGVSAILAACETVARLPERATELFSGTSDAGPVVVSVGRIVGGERVNAVPARCRLELDVRLPPGAHQVTRESASRLIRDCTREDVRTASSITLYNPPSETPAGDPFWTAVRGICADHGVGSSGDPVYSGPTDARFLRQRLNVPTVVCGPGDERLAHRDDERVPLAEIHRAAQIYFALLTRHAF
ncbi:M20 family metallopeptidase [Streptomyces sp. NBC_01477]|uniref:M20 family metallopeptidase n=1 Tax=Streptomyces sp. NBC_01477 TaxID=2976015 RepID=UPI002E37D69C|nr:M20/M25/M40 family metallo-hydrolase [Streptomyces sp. NBC_01477]